MPRKGESDGNSTQASGLKRVNQTSTGAQGETSRGNNTPKRSRSPPKGNGAGQSKQARTLPRNVSLNPFSCWAGSQIQVSDERSIPVTDKIVERVVVPKPEERLVQVLSRDLTPHSELTVSTAPKQTGSGVSAAEVRLASSGVSAAVAGLASSTSPVPADSTPGDPPTSRISDHGPLLRRTSSARELRKRLNEPQPVSKGISGSASPSRERIVNLPSVPDADSKSRLQTPPAGPTQETARSKLAIPCACHKENVIITGQTGSQKSKVEARMGMGAGHGGPWQEQGRGPPRDHEDDTDTRRQNPTGFRVPRRDNAAQAGHPREGRSTSPRQDPMDSRNDIHQQPAHMARRGRPPLRSRPNSAGRTVGRPPSTGSGSHPKGQNVREDTALRKGKAVASAQKLGDEYWHEGKRRQLVASGANKSPRAGTVRRKWRGTPAPIGDFYPEEGDIILRNRKWPNQNMIEFFHFSEDGQSRIHEHDHLLRQNPQYDAKADRLICTCRLWRAAVVEVEDSAGKVGRRDLRMHELGSAEVDFANFRARQASDLGAKRLFGRKFEPRGF